MREMLADRQLAMRPRNTDRDTGLTLESVRQADWSLIAAVTVSGVVGLAAMMWAYQNRYILTYSDAFAHINIARRVFDSQTPGFVQLGTVWLPVPHLLMMPFVYIDFLWMSGLAGSVVGWLCLLATAASLFLSIRLVTHNELAAWAGLFVLLSNPNLLYMQTTPMTEPVLFMSMTSSAYFLIKWSQRGRIFDLMVSGVLAALAVGSRYDGWFFAVMAGGVVLATAYQRSRNPGRAEGTTLAYIVIPVYAMFLWMFYNWMYFGDPLEFQRGQWSAQYQQEQLAGAGGLPTRHNLPLSFETYSWAAIDNLGLIVLLLGAAGLLLYVYSTRFRWPTWTPYAFLAAYPFNILSLWLGQTVVVVPQSAHPGYWNVRYGLMLLPGVALFFGYLVHFITLRIRVQPLLAAMAIGAVLITQALFYVPGWPLSIITLADGVAGSSETLRVPRGAAYLRANYDGGNILIDDTNSVFIHAVGFPMREYLGTFSGPLWEAGKQDPRSVAAWVVFNRGTDSDRLVPALVNNPNFTGQFALQYDDGNYAIYRRLGD